MSTRVKPKKKTPETVNGAARYRKRWVPWLWVGAPIVIVFIFYIYPFINTFILSFTDADPLSGRGDPVGLQNYMAMFKDPTFWTATLNSVVYALIVVPLMTMIPLLLAVLVKEWVPGIGIFRSLYYIPAVSSLVVISLGWQAMLKDDGWLNVLLKNIGVVDQPVPFLTGRWWLLISAMLITLWQGIPYYMLMYMAALANVDRSLYEAAEIDGANAFQRFFHVTIPGVRLMMALVATLVSIGCLKIFTEVQLLSNGTGGIGGRSQTLTMYIRGEGLDPLYGSLGAGSAAAVFLFFITVGFIVLSQRLSDER
ncbi:sugar ABC transporter permease [Trueperella sp.]|uniref:carbohydrate ABC transporter permease n=1 Tax=Trueperella sp. TaxID=2699835 RepID=UPI0022EB0EA6|nr:sugar ABC transporter permease [Trueperella sp.]